MEEYKSNSHKSKESKAADKQIKKVVSGKATTRKKTELQKLTDVFIADDVSSVKSYIIMDVLVPAIKKGLYDIVTGGIDMILYGGSGSSSTRSTGSKVSYISYDKKYANRRDEPRDYKSARSKTSIDYDNIIFNNRGDAEKVLTALDEIIERYDIASVNDLYELADVSSDNYTLNKYGWTNIRNAEVVRIRDGYVIKLPKPMPID